MSTLYLIIFGIINLLTNIIQSATGFGGGVLAMPFAAYFFGVRTLIPVFLSLGLIINIYIFLISYKNFSLKHYLNLVIFMGLGIPFGIYIFANFPEHLLEKIIAVFILIVSVRGLYEKFLNNNLTKKINNNILKFILFLAGCVQGAFGIGGPLAVIYTAQVIEDKKTFRATLSLLWITLNSFLVTRGIVNGVVSREMMIMVVFTLPFIFAGAFIGNKIHHKVNNQLFLKGVYLVLFISGLVMFWD